jgi:pilus assembly protein CpaE
MGRPQPSQDLNKMQRLRLNSPVTVLAAGEQLERLRASDGAHLLDRMTLVEMELHEEITGEHLTGAGILVIQVDPTVSGSMRRIERVRNLRPDLPQIAALESADAGLVRTLLREGVADVVALPLTAHDMFEAAISVLQSRTPQPDPRAAMAPMVVVARALGGSGATTLVTQLAAEFAKGARACIFDLDLQFGRVADVLGLQPRRNLTDLLDAGVRIDASFMHSVAAQHASGISVIAAPKDILPLESVDAEQLHKVLGIARQEYDFVFVDMPSNLTNWSLSVLAEADSILMVVEQSLASLRQAKRRLDLFQTVGIQNQTVGVVVNRMERRLFGSINLRDAEEALGRKVLQGLHADGQNIGLAQDQGMLVSQIRGKNAYAGDVSKLAKALTQLLEQGSRR